DLRSAVRGRGGGHVRGPLHPRSAGERRRHPLHRRAKRRPRGIPEREDHRRRRLRPFRGGIPMNLPNKLTILRACMIPVFVVLALMTPFWAQRTAAIVFALASFTDYLDGHIARKYGLVTNFGKFMDPIADKLLVMSAFVVLVGQG